MTEYSGYTGLVRTVDATVEPISVSDVNGWLALNTNPIRTSMLIKTARDRAERYMHRAMNTQSWRMSRDLWPGGSVDWWDAWHAIRTEAGHYYIELPYAPLQSVTSVKTYDIDDTATTITVDDVFIVDTDAQPGRLILRTGQPWPVDTRRGVRVEIVYVAGYGDDPEDVPAEFRQGMLQHVAWMHENRGDEGSGKDGFIESGARSHYKRIWSID
jgi:uncharacterized phiE125 gp8 family phage protein